MAGLSFRVTSLLATCGRAGEPEIVGEEGFLMKKRKRSKFGKDKRRKHRHWMVTVFYADGEKFGRVYIDREKAIRFAERQKNSPVVRTARVTQLD